MTRLTWPRFSLLPLLALTACSGESKAPAATLTIDPPSLRTHAGAAAQTFTATVTHGSGTVAWTLTGIGTLSAAHGSLTTYLPPATLPGQDAATLQAMLSDASASATIVVTPVAPATGSLRISVASEVPSGVASRAKVKVTGPAGFAQDVTEDRTLVDLGPGTYSVTASDIQAAGQGVDARYRGAVTCDTTAPPSAATTCTRDVVAGEVAQVTVAYRRVPGTGLLWIPSYAQGKVAAYPASQLSSSNSEPPLSTIDGAASAQGVAFDAAGRLWVSDWDANRIRAYDPSPGQSASPPTPLVVIAGSLSNPTGLAFDVEGSLWVTNRGNSSVVKFGASQLAASGSPAPAVVLGDDGSGNLSGPTGIALDREGSLWFTNAFSRSLHAYRRPGALSGAVATSPDIIISSTLQGGGSLGDPSGLAFDSRGNLWVANGSLNTLVMFGAGQLGESGTPTPSVVIGGSLGGPSGLAFDAAGNLWVSNSGSAILRFAAGQLTSSGTPNPGVALTGVLGVGLGLLAFNPAPTGLPLAR
jgi:sugar lactone lactonase YvrE